MPTVWAQQCDCDARARWEDLVKAKGGRENLDGLASFYWQMRHSWWDGIFYTTYEKRTVYALPDFLWSWIDHGNWMFGIEVSHLYPELGYSVSPWRNRHMRRPLDNSHWVSELLALLGETRWHKPDHLECDCSGDEIALTATYAAIPYPLVFWQERGGGLPHRVEIRCPARATTYHVQGYRTIGGLRLPTTIRIAEGGRRLRYQAAFEVNPRVDEGLRSKLPSVEAGPEAWRAKPADRKQKQR